MGGKTIAEAKENLSLEEAFRWMDYYQLRGTFRVTRKLEWGFGMVSMLLDRSLGGKREMGDFMPYEKKPEIEDDLGELMKILSGGK